MTPRLLVSLAAVLLLGAVIPSSADDPLRVTGLRCEYAVDPLGIDVAAPRLSWQLASGARGQRQTAWQVLVASTREALDADRGDLWDSGQVASAASTHVPYAGRPLISSQQVFWKVRAWDAHGAATAWSAPSTWTMGILKGEEAGPDFPKAGSHGFAAGGWRGSWITAEGASETLLLRREVDLGPGLRRAIVHVTGLGQYELRINGRRVGEDLFTPGWTDYADTTLYDTYDATSHLRAGGNAIGLTLGNGMYHVVRRNRFAKFTGSFGPQRALLHLRLEYADGSVEFVGTDTSWRTHPGPVTFASMYGGEDHDARLEPDSWDRPGFDDRHWRRAVPALLVTGRLAGHSGGSEPIRVIERRAPVGVRAFADSSAVYDFGQNASFLPSLTVTGPAGSTVRLTPAEVVNADGTIYRGTMGGPHRGSSWWQYTKATDAPETWTPRFYYVGSRYVKAEVIAADEDAPSAAAGADPSPLPAIASLGMLVVHAAAAPVGEFTASNPRLGRIRDLVRWAQRSNMVSVLTDCPHREKLGWIEQFHLNGPSIRYEFDTARIFTKAVADMADAQTADGLVPNIAPEYVVFEGAFRNAAEWGAAFVLVPWQQYVFTGDVDLLRTHYDAMVRYVAFLEGRTRDGLLHDGLGDWYDLELGKPGRAGLTPAPITATAFLVEDLRVLSKVAGVLGRTSDADALAARAADLRGRCNREFFRADTGTYATGSQAALAIPLVMGLVEPAHRARVLDALVRDVETRGYATAGDIGFRHLLRALADAERSDVVYRLIDQDETVFVPLPRVGAVVTEGGAPAGDRPGVRLIRLEEGAAVFAIASGRYVFHAR